VLTDKLAETVADLWAAAVPVAICLLWRKLFNGIRKRSDLLDRAEADAVGLPKGSIDGTGLRDSHFGTADKGGDIRRIGVTVAHEALASFRPEYGRLKSEPAGGCVGKLLDELNAHTGAAIASCYAEKTSICYVPVRLQENQIAGRN
jgi:hypothetical protein